MGGGKTQQRVAGNAKPSSSGRIRELLINQQVAPGNVITFSALSAKNQQTNKPKSQNVVAKREKPAKVSSTEDDSKPTSESHEFKAPSSQDQQQPQTNVITSSPCIKDTSTRLVVRRVGNRDFYSRVKVSNDQELNDEELLVPAVKPSEAGVKKPPSELLEQISELTLDTGRDVEQIETLSASDEIEAVELASDDPDEGLDFFGLLDRLEQARILVEAKPKASTLRELNEKAMDHEIDLLKLIRILMRKFIQDLSIEDWDLISTMLNQWVNWISRTNYPLQEIYHSRFCAETFSFIHQLIIQAEKIKAEPSQVSTFPLMQSLLDDWANFKSSSMFLDLITLFLKLVALENDVDHHSNPTIRPMLEALAHIILSVDTLVVLSHHNLLEYLKAEVQFDQEFNRPKNSHFTSIDHKQFNSFVAVCGLMRSNFRVILVTAHSILSKTMKTICESTRSNMLMHDQQSVDDVLIFPPESLMAILTSRDSIMSALLSEYRVGDISVTIEPNTDSYACTLSYLFAWDLTIQFIVGVEKELGQSMIHGLKRLGLIQRLLDTVFMLLPPLDERDSLNFRIESADENEQALSQFEWNIDAFLKSPLRTTVKRPVNEIELVSLHIYFSVASHMPVTVRKWYNNNANKRLCNLVNEYTVKHISKVICSLEMESVLEKCQERANRDEPTNLVIKARPSAKEVYAIYTRDEFKMELTIKLPQNYPLGPVQIDGGKRVGVTDVKWRSWLLQLTTFLAHQNGPILDGIDLWRTNIDKRFEGVEKCTICFSILHSNYQLPKKRCQTCANMFHNLCLYKWFESSGNSTCPLCRNPW